MGNTAGNKIGNIAIAIHGGASEAYPFLKKHLKEHEEGLRKAIELGYSILKKKGSALNAVEETVKALEDNPLFNAGRGSALNARGEVEMDAAIMDGKKVQAGAVSMVRGVKNPISLARNVMLHTNHVFLSGYGALDFARTKDIIIEPESYFFTEHQFESYLKEKNRKKNLDIYHRRGHGTVGAVALDKKGNLAAGTSTGGTSFCLPGRIGDSCIIGGGCYANNDTCAVSGTGTGEVLINNVIAHTVSSFLELKKYPIQKACYYVIHKRKRTPRGEIGVISVDRKGNVGMAFNTEIMKRAWIDAKGQLFVKIYR